MYYNSTYMFVYIYVAIFVCVCGLWAHIGTCILYTYVVHPIAYIKALYMYTFLGCVHHILHYRYIQFVYIRRATPSPSVQSSYVFLFHLTVCYIISYMNMTNRYRVITDLLIDHIVSNIPNVFFF